MIETHMGTLRKFSSQADPDVLEALQEVAAREGRQFQAVLGDAMRDYLAQKQNKAPRRSVIEAFQESLNARDDLYRSLAK
jgi:predicted transcriptional regulator